MSNDLEISLYIDGEEQEIIFENNIDNCYKSKDGKIELAVEVDDRSYGKKFLIKRCGAIYTAMQEEIIGAFEVKYNQLLRDRQENYESGFEDAQEEEGEAIKVPYDPQLITVAPAKFSLKEIVGMIDGEEDEEPVLDLAPDFQRDYVWDSGRKSRLIESILLNIPLPVFYFARDKDGKMQVVDGVQRLTTIHKYFKNEFKLSKLEYLEDECDGRYFKRSDLPEEKSLRPKLVRALRQYQIDCNIIEPSTPENVKLDIFKRLNTGGKELNKQEVRHAFMKKDVRDFVKELVESEEFKRATCGSISDKRMMAQELVLRYIGFYCLFHDSFVDISYMTKMDEFVDAVAIELNQCRKIPYSRIRKMFLDSMDKAHRMFGNLAFRKIDMNEDGTVCYYRNPVNKSLFITFSILLSGYDMKKIDKRGAVVKEFAEYLNRDEMFYNAISHNTNYLLKDVAMGKVRDFLDGLYH